MSNIRLQRGQYRPLSDIQCTNRPLGQILIDAGRISPTDLVNSLDAHQRTGARLGEVLLASGAITAKTLSEALARQRSLPYRLTPEGQGLYTDADPTFWIKAGLVPWGRTSQGWQIAAKDYDSYQRHAPEIARRLGTHEFVWSTPDVIEKRLQSLFEAQLIQAAEAPPEAGCATLNYARLKWGSMTLLTALACALCTFPAITFIGLITLGACLLLLSVLHKTHLILTSPRQIKDRPLYQPDILPKLSLLVPLFQEKDIVAQLIKRLSQLDYPHSHLEAILILEAEDTQTADIIRRHKLPNWMRVMRIPKGHVQTKPRAMNYALGFCSGDIIGIYDAEDAPEPDQLRKVVATFATAPPNTACVQGALDFYNTHSNWIARCFTIEYNGWFRTLLPALSASDHVVPLGGTTVFFRRDILQELNAWDAHNVTEDCDLGVRLVRRGYRCEILNSTTFEEANSHWFSWIKQRSRWLKGYYITYFAHMRDIRRLFQDLGWRRFWGFQMLFLPTMILIPLAPIFWGFWLVTLGILDPQSLGLSQGAMVWLSSIFIVSFASDIIVNILGTIRSGHKGLLPWVPTTYLYFPLASLASYKALFELCTNPFYWDKTMHGQKKSKE